MNEEKHVSKHIKKVIETLNKTSVFYKNSKVNNHIDFSKTIESFTSDRGKVILICPIHGEFEVSYRSITRKERSSEYCLCKKCKKDLQIREYTENILRKIDELNEERGTNIEFLGFTNPNNFKIKLHCTVHDYYWETDYYNLYCNNSIGCPYCISSNLAEIHKISAEEAYNRLIDVHGNELDKFDFSPVLNSFTGTNNYVNSICLSHGPYRAKYYTILKPGLTCGCPACTLNSSSNIEEYCYNELIDLLNMDRELIERHYMFRVYDSILKINRKIYVDFYISSLNTIIEYDGKQHVEETSLFHKTHDDFINQVNRDRCLERFCKENNYKILRISYKDNNRIPEILKAFFEEGKDITTKVEPKLLPIPYGENIINRS